MSELQHPESRSFELVADLYERARPEYPAAAVAWIAAELDLREGRTVLDIGAGTGKLTRALVRTGARVIAVEPGEQMLGQLCRAVPDAEALIGAAEAIPLETACVDGVTAGQSFHWFRHEAIAELRRVLRAGGALALIWNTRDHEHPVQREVRELIAPLVPAGRAEVGPEGLEESGLFGPPAERHFRFVQELDADGLVARIGSVSFVASAAPESRAEVERRLRAIVERAGGRIDFPYLTKVFITRAV